MLKTIAIAALILMPFPAFAADLPMAAAPVEAAVAPSYDWTGAFVGGYVGGVWVGDTYNSGNGVNQPFNQSGGTVGGLVGYNFQSSNFVFGVELDGGWVSASSTDLVVGPGPVKTSLNWDAHLQGRVGVAVDKALFYISGGGAAGNFTEDASPKYTSITNTLYGWVVGAGIEYALSDNLTLRGEYLYSSYGPSPFLYTGIAPGGTVTSSFVTQEARIGLSYKF